MVNNSTNVKKNEQSLFTSKKTTTQDVGNTGTGLRQAQECVEIQVLAWDRHKSVLKYRYWLETGTRVC